MKQIIIAFVATLSFFIWPSGQMTATGPVATNCKAEIAKFCAQEEHGDGEVRECLKDNRENLSSLCKEALDTTGFDRDNRRGKRRR